MTFIWMLSNTYRTNIGMIGQHEPRNPMRRLYIGRFARQSHLDASRTPRDKLGQLPLSDPLQGFVHLSGIDLAL